MEDLLHFMGLTPTVSIGCVVKTADTNGASADLQGYEGGALIVAALGANGDTMSATVKMEIEVEESDDDSTFSDVADTDLLNFVAGTNDGCMAVDDGTADDLQFYIAQYTGSKRYIRGVLNVTGTHSTGTIVGIAIIPLGYKYPPTA